MCGRQIVLFFGQETVVEVETCEILLPGIYFFEKEAFTVETFLCCQKIFFTLSFYNIVNIHNKAQ